MPSERHASEEKAKGRVRLTFEFTDEVHAKLIEVKERSGSASIVEVVRRALAVYDLLSDHTAQGGKVVAVHKDGVQEVIRLL